MRTSRDLATVSLERLERVSGGRWDGFQYSPSGIALDQAKNRFKRAPDQASTPANPPKQNRGVYVWDLLFH